MSNVGVNVGEILVAVGSYTAALNDTHKYNITKGKMYKVVSLCNTSFSVVDDFSAELSFQYESLKEKSIFYMFNRLNVERVKKIKTLY